MMALDKRYLKKHGNQWVVVVKVPERLRKIIGKAHLKHPLHSDSLAFANREKFKHVAEMKTQIEAAEREARRNAKLPPDPQVEEAFHWREDLKNAAESIEPDEGTRYDGGEGEGETEYDVIRSLLGDRAEEIEKRDGIIRARTFVDIATGKGTPINSMIDGWLAETNMKPRQKIDYRRAVTKFSAWLIDNKLPETIEACTRKVAGRYVSGKFVAASVNVRTANKDISAISSYWRWLTKKGYIETNIWERQSLPKPKGKTKRPYNDDEMLVLFSGSPTPLLRDFMLIAAFSGMRVEEIARLKYESVADFSGVRVFDITEAKSVAGVRKVPIHSALEATIERRLTRKAAGDSLFPEIKVPGPDSPVERSQKVVKAFTTYRRKVGVDDVSPGARQSRVDFHSFRRWFVTQAEQADNHTSVIDSVIGHNRQELSMNTYSGGPSIKQYQKVVESVVLNGFDFQSI